MRTRRGGVVAVGVALLVGLLVWTTGRDAPPLAEPGDGFTILDEEIREAKRTYRFEQSVESR